MYLAGCPQLADDNFTKTGKVDTDGSGDTRGSGGSSLTGIVIDGTGGGTSASGNTTETDGAGGTMSGAAGAGVDVGTESSSTESGSSGGSTSSAVATSTGGSGGTTTAKEPTTLVYATTDNSIYAATWAGTSFDPASLWNTASGTVAFVQARYAPDGSWGLAAYQADAGANCTLWVHRFRGTQSEAPIEISIGDADTCLTARGFDIAFEQQSGRALLVYATQAGSLEYRWVDTDTMAEPDTLAGTSMTGTINWVRAVPDYTSNRIAIGYSAEGSLYDPLVVQEWDGSAFGDAYDLANDGAILNAQSFDFAYFQGSLLALRGDSVSYGVFSSIRDSGNNWGNEQDSSAALDGNAQNVELSRLPYGIAGAVYDADGGTASLGVLFWESDDFSEETLLDGSLPRVSVFESPSLKTDIARLGDSAVMVYSDDYNGESGRGTGLGWAIKGPASDWALQSETLPIPHEQETRDAYAYSIRLARHEVGQEGLVLVFGEDDGLFESHLSSLQAGWSTPKLIVADVESVESTPFSIAGPIQ